MAVRHLSNDATAPPTSCTHARGRAFTFLALPILAAFLSSLLWDVRDYHVWPWDQALYGAASVDLAYALVRSPQQWPALLVHTLGDQQPGTAWLGELFVPIGLVLGRVEVGLLLLTALCQAGTLWLIARIGWRLSGGSLLVAVAGVLTAAAAPLFIGLSTQYFNEPLQALAVTSFFYLALRAPSLPRLTLGACLIGLSALGMAAKITTPLYCLCPGLVAAFYVLRSGRPVWPSKVSGVVWSSVLLAASLLAFALVADWYGQNVVNTIVHVGIATTNTLFGTEAPFPEKVWIWLGTIAQGFFSIPTFLVATSVVVAAVWRFASSKRYERLLRPTTLSNDDIVVLSAWVQFVIFLIAISSQVNQDSRFLLAATPLLSIMAIGLVRMAGSKFIQGAYVLVYAAQLIACYMQTEGSSAAIAGFYNRPPFIPFLSQLPPAGSLYLATNATDPTEFNAVNAAVDASCDPQPGQAVVAVSYDFINENTANFFGAKAQLHTNVRCRYVGLGFPTTGADAVERLRSDQAEYVISREAPPLDAVNAGALPALHYLQASPQYQGRVVDPAVGLLVFQKRSS